MTCPISSDNIMDDVIFSFHQSTIRCTSWALGNMQPFLVLLLPQSEVPVLQPSQLTRKQRLQMEVPLRNRGSLSQSYLVLALVVFAQMTPLVGLQLYCFSTVTLLMYQFLVKVKQQLKKSSRVLVLWPCGHFLSQGKVVGVI